jgi:hypothetical protein
VSSEVVITSEFGDLQVVVLMPGDGNQLGYSFRPSARTDGLKDVPRRDLSIIRSMLQDALDDVDDERHRRMREAAPETGMPVPPRPAGW